MSTSYAFYLRHDSVEHVSEHAVVLERLLGYVAYGAQKADVAVHAETAGTGARVSDM